MMEDFSNQIKTLLDSIEKHGLDVITMWSRGLKKKSMDTALQEVATFIAALLIRQDSPAKLFEIIEAIRGGFHQINSGCEGIKNQDEAIQYLQILAEEAKVYDQLIQRIDSTDINILSIVVHQSMAALIHRHLIYYQHYLPIPEKEWLRINRLFYIAIQKKISSFVTADKIYFQGKSLSIQNLYAMSILLSCGRLNQLSPKDISGICKSMPDWCTLVKLSRKPSSSSENQLVVDLSSGSAPNFKKLFSSSETSFSCYLQVDSLIEKLDFLFSSEANKMAITASIKTTRVAIITSQLLKPDVIKHLKLAWTEYIYREKRIKTDEVILACWSFKNIFFYLAGGQTLKQFIGAKASLSVVYSPGTDIATVEKERRGDIWTSFLSVPAGNHVTGVIPTEFNFQHFFPNRNQQKNPDHPVFTIKMTDSSSKGCRLIWTTPFNKSPEVGELVGLCKNTSRDHWQVGEVAWRSQADDGEITTGIRLLSTVAIPVAVDVPLRIGNKENYTSGIIFPPEKQIGTRAVSLVLSSLKLNPGDYVAVSQKGIEENIYLNKPLKKNAFFESHECAFVIKQPLVAGSIKK